MANPITEDPTITPYLSKLTLKNKTFIIKDAWVRAELEDVKQSIAGGVVFCGVLASGSSISDGESIKDLTVIDGLGTKTVPIADQKDGSLFVYTTNGKNLEFIVSSGKYSELGSTGTLGAFAYANQGSGAVTIPIQSAITFNPLTPSVTKGTLEVTCATSTISVTTESATGSGTFSPAAITIPASSVAFTPSTSTFVALGDVTYDSTTSTLTINEVTSDPYWKTGTTGTIAAQTVTPPGGQSISVSYEKAKAASLTALTSASLTGDLSVSAITPTATITNPTVTVTVTPASS